jgi:hypothetical protein
MQEMNKTIIKNDLNTFVNGNHAFERLSKILIDRKINILFILTEHA